MSTSTRRVTTDAAAEPDWARALCAQTDPALFFPDSHGAGVTQAIKKAKKVCGTCPIQPGCQTWALDTQQASGVWGGLDEDERRLVLRERSARLNNQYEMCIEAQDRIEGWAADGWSHRRIAKELGVGHWVVGRAFRFFQSERPAVAQGAQEVTAA